MVDYYGSYRGKANAIWHMDNSLNDTSGNAQNLSNSSGTPTFVFGKRFGYSASYTPNQSHKVSTASAYFDVSAFSAGLWMYCTSSSNTGCLFGNFGSSGANTYGFTTRFNSLRSFQLLIADGNYNEGVNVTTSATYNNNQWYHLVVTYDGTNTGYIYVDGVLAASKTNFPTMPHSSTNNWPRIACRNIAGGDDTFFTGYIDDVWLAPYVISAQNVKRLYATAIGKYE